MMRKIRSMLILKRRKKMTREWNLLMVIIIIWHNLYNISKILYVLITFQYILMIIIEGRNVWCRKVMIISLPTCRSSFRIWSGVNPSFFCLRLSFDKYFIKYIRVIYYLNFLVVKLRFNFSGKLRKFLALMQIANARRTLYAALWSYTCCLMVSLNAL